MAATKDSEKPKSPVIEMGLCRCCRSIKKCRLITGQYEWMGTKEVYSEMMTDCYGILLSCLDEEKELCICAVCVSRLRDALAFRKQVLYWEDALIQAKNENHKIMVEVHVKPEPLHSDDDSQDADYMDTADHDDVEDTKDDEIKNKKPSKVGKAKLVKKTKTRETRSKTKQMNEGTKKHQQMKKKLQNEIKKTKVKLKDLYGTPETELQTQQTTLDSESKVFINAVTIVTNSYVCPFLNRVSNYYCFYCRDLYLDPNELREHTLTHDPKDFPNMLLSKKLPKIDVTRIDCRLCPEKISDLNTFKTHVAAAHGKEIHKDVDNEFLKFKLTRNDLKCTECEDVFPYFDLLTKHMAEHFGTFTCDSCGACFLEENSLLTHMRKHNAKKETSFPCEVCGKNLKSKYSMVLHVATVHEKRPTVDCYKCDQSFLSYAMLNKHLIEAHGDTRTFPCKLCDKVYNRRKTLMEHNRRNHLKVFRHQCDLCDQKFYLPSRLKEHMVTHTGERNFRCEFCDKSYPRLKTLKEHIRTHTNDRRYKCDICNSTFTQNGSLRSHMKSHHPGFADPVFN
ncbi:zinc finger protein 91 [Plutella xylostella]|uniref:zinc finger protein 91 n=1 Tax=Plutella xylostella TaxID=51655 RepID=UPI0020329A46|nr:zinc finger protein 91 [Plutella xylostella]